MSRSKNSKNDWRRYRKFEQENDKLRKEVNKLRRMINKMVVDNLGEKAERIDNGGKPVIQVCEVCGNDDLYAVPITRPDGKFEIKVCKSCNHRSPMRKL